MAESINESAPEVIIDSPESVQAPTSHNLYRLSPRARVCFIVCILCVGALIRFAGIRFVPPNPDERHWVSRSAQIIERFRAGDFNSVTTHLGHPGIPAAMLMATGQWVAQKLHPEASANFGISWFDPLTASRVANASLSLLAPLSLLLFAPFLGIETSLLAMGMMMFDSLVIGLARIAHIDAVLTLISTLTIACYLYAERYRSLSLKILAGFLWGLAIATKPTAAALVGVFLTYRLLRWTCGNRHSRPSLLTWGDIWAVVTGHVVLGATYTKLWLVNNTYITKHHIQPKLSLSIEMLSGFLRENALLTMVIGLLTAWLAIGLLRERQQYRRSTQQIEFRPHWFHLRMGLVLAGSLILLMCAFPVVSSNLVRFWGWVLGLSHREHQAYGMFWKAPGTGYSEIVFRRIPSVVFVGIAVGIGLLLTRAKQIYFSLGKDTYALVGLLLVAPIIWIAPLSVSSKQTMRYVSPIMPMLFLFAGWAFIEIISMIAKRRYSQPHTSGWFGTLRSPAFLPLTLFSLPIISQLYTTLSLRPYYDMQFNVFSGGAAAAYNHGWTFGALGYDKALRLVHEEAEKSGQPQHLEILGDYDLMKYAYDRYYPARPRRVDFKSFAGGYGNDWVLSFESFIKRIETDLTKYPHLKLAFEFKLLGLPIYKLYRSDYVDVSTPVVLPFHDAARKVGRIVEGPEGQDELAVVAGRASAAYLSFNEYIRLKPGSYLLRLPAFIPSDVGNSTSGLAPETKAFRVELSSRCKRDVYAHEISNPTPTEIQLRCDFTTPVRAQLSVYWYGRTSLRLRDPSVEALPSATPSAIASSVTEPSQKLVGHVQ